MLPSPTVNNPCNCAFGYSKTSCHICLADAAYAVNSPDLNDLRLCKNRPPTLFSATRHPPSLFHTISNVFFGGSGKEMARIATRWVVAMMTDIKSFSYWTRGDNVGISVRRNFRVSESKKTIAPINLVPQPRPAFIRASLFNFVPKSNLRRPPSLKCRCFFSWGRYSLTLLKSVGSFVSHSKSVLLCRAPGCFYNAGAICFPSLDNSPQMAT